MKISTLRDMTRDELKQRKIDLVDEQFNLQMRRTFKPLDNPLRLRELRRDLARIETIVKEDSKGIRQIVESGVDILKQK